MSIAFLAHVKMGVNDNMLLNIFGYDDVSLLFRMNEKKFTNVGPTKNVQFGQKLVCVWLHSLDEANFLPISFGKGKKSFMTTTRAKSPGYNCEE